MALTDPNGSNPEKLAEMQQYIAGRVGVMPNAYVPPATDGRTKLNLILGSANQRLDVFQGNWGDYKEVALPINDRLDQYGSNVGRAFSAEQWAGVTDSEGRIWSIPRLGVMGHTHPTWFNDQMLRDLNLPLPQTLEEAVATFEKIPESFIQHDHRGAEDRRWPYSSAGTRRSTSSAWLLVGGLSRPHLQPPERLPQRQVAW